MKCPQCLVRNSVAARQCKDCGTKFSRKGAPKSLILAGVGVVAVLGVGVAALSIVPAAFDPEQNLQKVARRVAAGPKSGSDAEHIKAELEGSMKEFLERNSKLSTPELTERLQRIFPNSAFESRVFDLPHNLRLVEVDTMLQATDYLMSGKHVAVLRNFEVFETAKVVPDGVGSNITLLGHRNAQAGHRPQVRVFALLPDGVADRTQESVPPISGDGSAVFAPNGKDINLDLSLMSKAAEERLFTIETLSHGAVPDETVKSHLTLKNGKYELSEESGKSALAALRATAFVLADPTAKDRFARFFDGSTAGSVASAGKLKVSPPLFTIKKVSSTKGGGGSDSDDSSRRSRRHSRRHRHQDSDSSSETQQASVSASPSAYTILLNNSHDAFEVGLAKRDARFVVTSFKRVKAASEGSEVIVEAKPDEGAATAPVGTAPAPANNDKIVTKVDDFGTQKVVPVDTSGKVVIKQASKESGVDVAADKGKKASVEALKTALASPPPAVIEQPKKPAAEPSEKNAIGSGVITTNDSTPYIKLRRGAAITYRSIGELKRGDTVRILGKKDDWYKVQVNGQTGFVYGEFVSTGKSAKTASADEKSSSAPKQSTASAPSASSESSSTVIRRTRNLRDEQHNRIGLAEAGSKVVVLGTGSNGKYKIRLASGAVGYVDREAFDGTPKISGRSGDNTEVRASSQSSDSGSSGRSSRHRRSHKSSEKSSSNASEMPQMVP